MTKIIKLGPIMILFLSFAFTVSAQQTKDDKKDDEADKTDIKVLEERITGNEKNTKTELDALKEQIKTQKENLEKQVNLYLAFAVALLAIISFLGYTTVTRWIKQTIESKTDEEVKKYVENKLREKAEAATAAILSELKEKAKETLSKLEELRTEYEGKLSVLRAKEIDITRPLSKKTVEDLEQLLEAYPRNTEVRVMSCCYPNLMVTGAIMEEGVLVLQAPYAAYTRTLALNVKD